MSERSFVISKTRLRSNERHEHELDLNRWWDRIFPDPVRKYILWNNLWPWAIVPPYMVYDYFLRRSPQLRAVWADPLKATVSPVHRCASLKPDPSSIANEYRYHPLESSDSIRLLYVLPGQTGEPMVCSIKHHKIGQAPEYCAVSYAWRQAKGQMAVTCDHKRLLLPLTIHQLLQRIKKSSGELVLWVDAVCINQAETPEKNRQVAMMGEIYSLASSTVLWLGEEDAETPKVAEVLKKLVDAGCPEASISQYDDQELPWRLDPSWTYLARFLERPWFTRTWVLQEVALSSRRVVRCGSYRWTWESLQRAVSRFKAQDTPDATGLRQLLSQGVLGFSEAQASPSDLSQPSLLELLIKARSTFASDPRDKVYAILSFAAKPTIRADYDRSVQDVYREAATACVEGGQFDVLCCAGDSVWNDIPGLPSWVPDWSCDARPKALSGHKMLDTHTPSIVRIDGKVLTLEVFEIDTLRATGVPWPGNVRHQAKHLPSFSVWETGPLAYTRLQSWRSMLWRRNDQNKQYFHTHEALDLAFARTIAADTATAAFHHGGGGAVYQQYRTRLLELRHLGPGRFFSDRAQRADDPLSEYHEAVKQMCFKRTFFITRKEYMGLGPFFAMPGDKVFLIRGVAVPLIMRRTWGGKYRLVGECYIHGLLVDEVEWSRLASGVIGIV